MPRRSTACNALSCLLVSTSKSSCKTVSFSNFMVQILRR